MGCGAFRWVRIHNRFCRRRIGFKFGANCTSNLTYSNVKTTRTWGFVIASKISSNWMQKWTSWWHLRFSKHRAFTMVPIFFSSHIILAVFASFLLEPTFPIKTTEKNEWILSNFRQDFAFLDPFLWSVFEIHELKECRKTGYITNLNQTKLKFTKVNCNYYKFTKNNEENGFEIKQITKLLNQRKERNVSLN